MLAVLCRCREMLPITDHQIISTQTSHDIVIVKIVLRYEKNVIYVSWFKLHNCPACELLELIPVL